MAGFLTSLFNPGANADSSAASTHEHVYTLDGQPVEDDGPSARSLGAESLEADRVGAAGEGHVGPAGAPTNDYMEPQSGSAQISDSSE